MDSPDASPRATAPADAWHERTEPEDPDRLPAEFLVEGRRAVRAIIDDLRSRHVLVTLYAMPDRRRFAIVAIEQVDDAEVEIDLTGQDEFAAVLRRSQNAIGVAFPDRIKIQFDLSGLSVLPATDTHGPALRARLPGRLHRLQRRDAFRVHPPASDGTRCVRVLAPGTEASYTIRDISAGGLSVLVADDKAPPSPGETWTRCRIETARQTPIPCDLVVRRITPVGERTHLVGLSFGPMPGEVLREVQILVIRIEKRLRSD